MIFITGDIHGDHDIHKFSANRFTMQKQPTRSDYMIICGRKILAGMVGR